VAALRDRPAPDAPRERGRSANVERKRGGTAVKSGKMLQTCGSSALPWIGRGVIVARNTDILFRSEGLRVAGYVTGGRSWCP